MIDAAERTSNACQEPDSIMEGMKPPPVVVGIATYNRADELRRAINSALAQAYAPLRIAVVDDGSTDETAGMNAAFPSVCWDKRPVRKGQVQARNDLMLSASETYYASLDDDAWFLRGDEIARAIAFLEEHPDVAVVAFDILSPDRPDPAPRGTHRDVGTFIGCGHVVRLSVVRALKGYSAFPKIYGSEEPDLALRIIDAGYRIVMLGGVHVWHERTPKARDFQLQHRFGVCNDLVMAVRRAPFFLMPVAVFWKVFSHFWFALSGRWVRSTSLGFWDFFGLAGDAWNSRKPVRYSSYLRFLALSRRPSGLGHSG